MVTRNIEGTISFDGLIEGRIPADFAHEVEPKLREWVTFARSAGVKFALEVDGTTFSLLVDSQPLPIARIGEDPAATIKQLLGQLLQAFPPPHRTGVFSTLRSSEFKPGVEVQTIYTIVPPGRVDIQERQVDASTQKPEEPLSNSERIKLGVYGLVVAAIVLAIGSLFIDYGALWSQISNTVRPIDTEQIAIETGAYADLLSVEKIETQSIDRKLCLVVTVKPAEGFPRTDEQLDARWQEAATLQEKLAIEALARRAMRVEQYDAEGKLIATSEVALTRADEGGKLRLVIPITRKTRPASVRLLY